MKTTETTATKPAVKKPAPAAKKPAATKPTAIAKTAAAATLVVEQFRKEAGKTVSIIAARVANRKNCWNFQYKNLPFVIFAKPGSETAAVQKVVQQFNVTAK